jgi:bifunctional UDP-N-acetylglucosamine pyrophosphorylase/glucosamine-1-phosphate N-acetyltransferase
MTGPVVVIIAAGRGTRMRSALPKVLHPVCGRPMILWPIAAARAAGAGKVIVVDGPDRALEPVLPDDVEVVVQAEAKGTGDAVRAAVPAFDAKAPVVILSGDVPLITAQAIGELAAAHDAAGAGATLVSMRLEDPSGYGRVVRSADGAVERVVETKAGGDASPEELALDEVNAGIYAFDADALAAALGELRSDNAQGEYYLPDVLPLLRERGLGVAALEIADPTGALGVNDRVDLATVTALARRRIQEKHMRAGVTFLDPSSTQVDAEVEIGQDAIIGAATNLLGMTRIGATAEVGPLTTVKDSSIGEGARVVHSYLDSAEVGDEVSVGPFAYLRPGAVLRRGSKVGTFVEIKNSDIGEGAKIPHLSYIGDTDLGEGSNLGAGTITANYDGRAKHRTTIGARVRGGVDTSFVAPVTVGDDALTAAGSVITEDIPEGALGVARERQRNVTDYAERTPAQE